MIRLVSAVLALAVLAGCSTPMYRAPAAGEAAVLQIENLLDEGKGDDAAAGGWVTPAMNTPSRAGFFTIDGERLEEQGGDERALLRPGKHEIQIFADDAGVLRFGTFTLKVDAGDKYLVRIRKGTEASYQAEVVHAAAPEKTVKEVNF